MWHLENDDNYVLTLFDLEQDSNGGGGFMTDKVSCVKYEDKGKVLIGGTKEGKIVFWKNMSGNKLYLKTNKQFRKNK